MMIAFIEFTQFQQTIKAKALEESAEELALFEYQMALLENKAIPKSFVVHAELTELMKEGQSGRGHVAQLSKMVDEDIFRFCVRARALYNKYVEGGGELQINVSSSQKKRVKSAIATSFGALTDIFALFQDIIQEL